jgi:hypothetical protein
VRGASLPARRRKRAISPRQCEAYVQANPFRFRIKRDEASNRHLAFLEGRKPPRYLGLILGEVVHDFRCALDHTAWQLAIQESGLEAVSKAKVRRKIQFPIGRTEPAFRNHDALPYFSEAAVETMAGFQPYHNVGSRLVNPLLVIQHMSNADKHQVLTPSMGQFSLDQLSGGATEQLSSDAIEVLAEPDTVVDTSKAFLAIKASPEAQIQIQEQYVQVCFWTDATGAPDFILAERIEPSCLQVADVLEACAVFFPAVDWSSRRRELAGTRSALIGDPKTRASVAALWQQQTAAKPRAGGLAGR